MTSARQIACAVFMTRPDSFRFNEQTAANNSFQRSDSAFASAAVIEEWNALACMLESEGVRVYRFDSPPDAPDAVFPNNWVSIHEGGVMALYPMYAPNRRAERKIETIESLNKIAGITKVVDYSTFELSGKFLEGTGSMALDRANRACYAALSERTNEELVNLFCADFGYSPLIFHAYDIRGSAVYHTNVIMSIGENFAVVCLDSITNDDEKRLIRKTLEESGKEVIVITMRQMQNFAGNCLQLQGEQGKRVLVMSERGYNSLDASQKKRLSANNDSIILPPLANIESCGGGSARCMLSEIF